MKKRMIVCGVLAVSLFCFGGCDKLDKITKPPVEEVSAAQIETQTPEPTTAPTATPEPTAEPTIAPTAEPTPGPTPEPTAEPLVMPETVNSPYASEYPDPLVTDSTLPNKTLGWYFNKNAKHQPPTAQRDFDIRPFDAYYLGDITQKEFYLTFDEGYENGFTGKILDVLAEKNVKATFFLTKPYITSSPDLVLRMVNEGHVAANHSVTHPSLPSCTDAELQAEILGVEDAFRELTGQELHKFIRPPRGEYSVRTLAATKDLGYKTVFWSFAHKDWLVDDQPDPKDTYERVMSNLHNGEIILLHAVSSSNTEALADIIDGVLAEGYTFKTVEELP